MSQEEYMVLQDANDYTVGRLSDVLNDHDCANLTICPLCHVDDFTHVEGCPLGGA